MTILICITFVLMVLEQAPVANLQSSSSPSLNQLPNYAATHHNESSVYAETQFGIVIPSMTSSLSLGGNIYLRDVYMIERMQNINRERIPERIVHAKGAGAFGYFLVTNNITRYTKAKFLQPGTRTNVAVRFSTAARESGSADTNYDFKGFAIKYYTEDGIQDIAAINLPVFIIRDGASFPDVVRARKRNPQTHLFDPNSLWDLISLRQETTLFVLYLFSDIALPKSYRSIDGFAVNTFKMVNANGECVYVKFHWLSNQNKEYITLEESVTLAGTNPDVLTQDLFDNIQNKYFPSWTLKIQVMTFKQAEKHPYNPFDATKYWDLNDYPLTTVGKLTLNQNPDNYFAEVEQMAFAPSRMVPGIEPSPDRTLQARLMAYADTQLYRLGVNNGQIPVNACPFQVNTYQRDGFMNVGSNGGSAPNYFPNSFNGLNGNTKSYYDQSSFSACGDVMRKDTGDETNFDLAKD